MIGIFERREGGLLLFRERSSWQFESTAWRDTERYLLGFLIIRGHTLTLTVTHIDDS